MADAVTSRLCFVIGPIGEPDTETRIHADWLLEEIIEPVLSQLSNFKVVRADKISQPGMIDAQIIQHLFDADLVIADLSKGSSNAFYEIGIRHMHQRPIIHMQLADEKIPFDVSLYRAVKFSRLRPSDLKKARDDLRAAVQAVLAQDYKVDNPVTRTRGQIRLEQNATPEQQIILDQLSAIQDRIERMDVDLFGERENFGRTNKTKTIFVRADSSKALKSAIFALPHLDGMPPRTVFEVDGKNMHVKFDVPLSFVGSHNWVELRALILGISGVTEVFF